jgi:molybdopterin molybdotransferase
MIPVDEALANIFALLPSAVPSEKVSLREAPGRVLAADASASRDMPPFDCSAMDGYAVRSADVSVGVLLTVVGEAAAGARYPGSLRAGEAVRIFTGAPLPEGADHVIIQEDVEREGDTIRLKDKLDASSHVRPAGNDFRAGDRLAAPRPLSPADIMLIAAMNNTSVEVARRPVVAIIASGDELVMPGETPGPDQIISSNGFGLAALIEREGGIARILPIARDTIGSMTQVLDMARDADLIVTCGGASVGEHDLIGQASHELGIERAFHKVAMRPGKPLMAGRIHGKPFIGLPGNPVSALVCGTIFVLPALRVLLGLPAEPAPRLTATLAEPLPQNGPREHYMRAAYAAGSVRAFERQDSNLTRTMAEADCLLVRAPRAPAAAAGETVDLVLL